MRKVTRTAPAKINLGLDVTGTRPDGYHLLETVFQAVSIADTVTVELIDTPDIALTCDVAGEKYCLESGAALSGCCRVDRRRADTH